MNVLKRKLTLFRTQAARGTGGTKIGAQVIRDGGDSGAGLIRGFAVITRGEALGEDMWVDADFLQNTTDAINAAGVRGIKSRFTHPNLSGDGLGKVLGRVKNGRVSGDRVIADQHFIESAHNAPDGDLAKFVMDLAENDPDLFGASIAFRVDQPAVEEFMAAHQDGRGRFDSPDRRNTKNLPHFRLAELRAIDVVDEPAANPDGLFHRGAEMVKEADALLGYALGLNDTAPELVRLELDPERVSAYIKRFLAGHGLQVVPIWETPSAFTSSDSSPLVVVHNGDGDQSWRRSRDPKVWLARINAMLSDTTKDNVKAAADRLEAETRDRAAVSRGRFQERLDRTVYGGGR